MVQPFFKKQEITFLFRISQSKFFLFSDLRILLRTYSFLFNNFPLNTFFNPLIKNAVKIKPNVTITTIK